MNIVIGLARPDEAEAILKLQYLCYQREAALYDDYSIPPITQTLASLTAEYSTHRILVARAGDEVVGSVRALAKDGSCLIGRLIVHPRLQNQGLGGRLLTAIEREFSTVSRYELFTGDRSESNLHFYQKRGYVPFRTQALTPAVKIVYLEKPRTAAL